MDSIPRPDEVESVRVRVRVQSRDIEFELLPEFLDAVLILSEGGIRLRLSLVEAYMLMVGPPETFETESDYMTRMVFTIKCRDTGEPLTDWGKRETKKGYTSRRQDQGLGPVLPLEALPFTKCRLGNPEVVMPSDDKAHFAFLKTSTSAWMFELYVIRRRNSDGTVQAYRIESSSCVHRGAAISSLRDVTLMCVVSETECHRDLLKFASSMDRAVVSSIDGMLRRTYGTIFSQRRLHSST
jgi:hypothetical protein